MQAHCRTLPRHHSASLLHAGALAAGRAREGAVLGAASKAAAAQPTLAAAHNAAGLALEARGCVAAAGASFQAAAELLAPDPAAQMLPFMMGHGGAGGGASAPPPFTTTCVPHADSSWAPEPHVAAQLNLARALAAGGQHARALGVFQQLAFAGQQGGEKLAALDVHAALALAAAQLGAGARAEGQATLNTALTAALAAGAGDVAVAALGAMVAEHLGAGCLDEAFAALLQWGSALAEGGAQGSTAAAVARLWLALAAAAAAAGQGELADSAETALQQCCGQGSGAGGAASGLDAAALRSQLLALQAARAAGCGAAGQAVAASAAAVHICPWDAALRVQLAQLAAQQPRTAGAAWLACPSMHALRAAPAVGALAAAGHAPQLPSQQLAAAAAATRASALLRVAAPAVADDTAAEQVHLLRQLHATPDDTLSWYLCALVALQAAEGSQRSRDFARAGAACRGALAAVSALKARTTQEQQLGGSGSVSGGLAALSVQQLEALLARLHAAASECALHARRPGALQAARLHAEAAAAAAAAAGDAPAASAAQRHLARVAACEGRGVEAERAYRQAGAASHAGPAALGLAHLLAAGGRGQEAATLLLGACTRGSGGGSGAFAVPAQLEAARLLLREGRADEAREAAAAAAATAAGSGGGALAAEAAPAAHVMAAVTALAAAEQQQASGNSSSGDGGQPGGDVKQLLLGARWSAGQAVQAATALPGRSGQAAAGVAAATLAHVEELRGKSERAQEALLQALLCGWAGRGTPGWLQLQAGVLLGDARACAAAVHTDPACGEAWRALRLVAGAGGSGHGG